MCFQPDDPIGLALPRSPSTWHAKGLVPRWVMLWPFRCSARVKDLPQPSSEQVNRRSSSCFLANGEGAKRAGVREQPAANPPKNATQPRCSRLQNQGRTRQTCALYKQMFPAQCPSGCGAQYEYNQLIKVQRFYPTSTAVCKGEACQKKIGLHILCSPIRKALHKSILILNRWDSATVPGCPQEFRLGVIKILRHLTEFSTAELA